MRDPRTRLISDDGRAFVRYSEESYDVVSLELGQIFRPGISAFYTVDFYRQVRERMNDGAVVAQFVPLPFLTPETFSGVIRTFLDVFPVSTLWYNTSELLLVGTTGDVFPLSDDRLARLTESEVVHDDLAWSHWNGPRHWLNGPRRLSGYLPRRALVDRRAGRGRRDLP